VYVNLTLSIDERVVKRARRVAESLGMSLNQAVRQYLDELAGGDSVERDLAELRELSARSGGRSRGWRFDRDQVHDRS